MSGLEVFRNSEWDSISGNRHLYGVMTNTALQACRSGRDRLPFETGRQDAGRAIERSKRVTGREAVKAAQLRNWETAGALP